MENFLLQHNGGTRNEIKSLTKNRSYIKYLFSISITISNLSLTKQSYKILGRVGWGDVMVES
jgi:hypothetical protein